MESTRRRDVPISARIREFLVRLEDLVDAHEWPQLDREAIAATPGDDSALVLLRHRGDTARDEQFLVADHKMRRARTHPAILARSTGICVRRPANSTSPPPRRRVADEIGPPHSGPIARHCL